ncbi:recombination directionality factor [Microbacterium phage Cen1621]|uniref:Recombination directionality factor n=1 Tax=Microbacterium phage Cen1621 TaxID=2965191 RepID=A0A9E7QAC1_9CAUD|nr:recombination directionality factor [Microbacterium phage Cen1621]
MALKVFGTDPETQPKPRNSFADDIVGRFHAGYMLNNRPATVDEWRVTTGDPDVAERIHELLGGDAPQKWETKGENDIEIFSASAEVDIIIEKASALRQRMVFRNREGKIIYATDGEYKLDASGRPTDEPDPDASLSFQERKQRGRDGLGPVPDIELYFRLASDPDLGIFRFQTGSWSLVSDIAYNGIEQQLAEATEDGPATATLKLEPVSFVAKNGPRAGQTVSFTKSSIANIKAQAA